VGKGSAQFFLPFFTIQEGKTFFLEGTWASSHASSVLSHLIHFFVTCCNFPLSACPPKLLLSPDFFVQIEPSDAFDFHTKKSLNAKWLQIVQICPWPAK